MLFFSKTGLECIFYFIFLAKLVQNGGPTCNFILFFSKTDSECIFILFFSKTDSECIFILFFSKTGSEWKASLWPGSFCWWPWPTWIPSWSEQPTRILQMRRRRLIDSVDSVHRFSRFCSSIQSILFIDSRFCADIFNYFYFISFPVLFFFFNFNF